MQDECDGENVGDVQSDCRQRDNGVECRRRSDVDQRQDEAHHGYKAESIERHFELRVDLEKVSTLSSPPSGLEQSRLTLAKAFENGRPWSRAKAQVNREAEAKALKSPTKIIKKMATMKIFVAATEFVAK